MKGWANEVGKYTVTGARTWKCMSCNTTFQTQKGKKPLDVGADQKPIQTDCPNCHIVFTFVQAYA